MDRTIVAIASGEQAAGIAIIRMSGNEALSIADKVFKGASSPLSQQPSHSIHYGHIYKNNMILDEVLVSIFLAPRSYTTENTVEINCHGGALISRLILELLVENGAFIAEPGEFTKRAFLNGRIDLTEAEAVAELIGASNRLSLSNAVYQLSGVLLQKIKTLREALIFTAAQIESALDDPEHYDIDEMRDEIGKALDDTALQLSELTNSYENGRLIKSGIRTVILGRPNVGKSSLLNYLSGCDSAIVTDIAGTTRDLIKESVSMDGLLLNIIDTAGIRRTDDVIERIGIERSFEAAETAELLILLIDGSAPINEDDIRLIELIKDRTAVILVNKSDLTQAADIGQIHSLAGNIPIITASLANGSGLDGLKERIKNQFLGGISDISAGNIITSARQKQALSLALDALNNARVTFEAEMPEDLLPADIMDAYRYLGEIIGEAVSDDLVDTIFSGFCMGK